MSRPVVDVQRALNDPEYCKMHFDKLVEKIADRSGGIANVVFAELETAGEQIVIAGCLLKMIKAKLSAVSSMAYERIATSDKNSIDNLIQTVKDLNAMDEALEALYSGTFIIGSRFNPHGFKFHETAMDLCFESMLKCITEKKPAEKSA